MNYHEWNRALHKEFFNESRAGRRVYLNVSEERLNAMGRANGVETSGFDDFVAAIKAGPNGCKGSFCEQALKQKLRWEHDRLGEPPPYLASLCFFALAAGRESVHPQHAYYPRLWELLGDSNTSQGAPREFDRMRELWVDLETWSQRDQEGKLGMFKAQLVSQHLVNVGLPVAQVILSDEDRKILPVLFDAADLEPGSEMDSAGLAAAILALGGRARECLHSRTIKYLEQPVTDYCRIELLEMLQTELREWDGTVPPKAGDTDAAEVSVRAGLRIWLLKINPAMRMLSARLTACLPDKVEASDLMLSSARFPGVAYQCEAQAGRFTGCLTVADTLAPLTLDNVDWAQRTEFRCETTKIRLVLPASPVRVFVNALHASAGLRGYIEAAQLPFADEFYLAASDAVAADFSQWGAAHCAAWEEIQIQSGLPTGWRLFKGAEMKGGGGLEKRYNIFPRQPSPRLRFEGGVRAGTGARYFDFALPAVLVEWPAEVTGARINGAEIEASHRLFIPPDIVESCNTVTVHFADSTFVEEVFYVQRDGWNWREGGDFNGTDKHGQPAGDAASVRVRGARVHFNGAPPYMADPLTILDDATLLLGRKPGEIADLRHDSRLPEWPVVWIVSTRRREVQFAFFGQNGDEVAPIPVRAHGGHVKKWKEVLWVERKKIPPLKTFRQRELLRKYQEVARGL